MKRITLSFLMILFAFASCKEQIPIPKPPLFLRTEFPEHTYVKINVDCPYDFELSKVYTLKNVMKDGEMTCHKDIDLGKLNGTINFSYIDMKEPLSHYVNYANDKVDEHKIKATGIVRENIIHAEKRVYGTFFKLEGDVATPFQFYLTDSTNRFVNGVVYFNSVPNYDSLRPTLNYLEQDLYHLFNTFEWK
jgi:gliding motility-associated lipoprotein GldD